MTLEVNLRGVVTDSWGQQRIVLTASIEIDRGDFDVTFNVPLEGGRVLEGRTVKVEIDSTAIRQAP